MMRTVNAGGVFVSVVFIVATGGLSALHTAYAWRQMSVVKQQRKILEYILQEREEELPRTRKRDVLGGILVAAASAGTAAAVTDVSCTSNKLLLCAHPRETAGQ